MHPYVYCNLIYNSQYLEASEVPMSGYKHGLSIPKQTNKQTNKQKTMVHLHNGILPSIKKEGAPTLCNSMDGTREHYAK